MDIAALIKAVDDERFNPRFVRFLISEGLLPAAGGSRARPEYGARHVEKAKAYFAARDAGLSVEQVKLIASRDTHLTLPLIVGDGLTLVVDTNCLGDIDRDALSSSIQMTVEALLDIALKDEKTDDQTAEK